MILGNFKIALRLRDRRVFMWQSVKILNDFNPAGIYLLENNNRRRSGVFIVNLEHISHLVLLFLLLTLNM